jgi:osmoprotectant transport system ATP-binding protein
MIKLENVTKVYSGQSEPAVDELSLEVPDGEICILVGPSGCGKTTTMKMVNRLVEPTGGQIYVGGENILDMDPIKLRRSIGYVIQEIGLFPHMTIAENIGTVPRLLDWSKDRIAERVDELLSLVGMDPDQFRDRYPHELSGGQRQRIGVTRGLAADPPHMLMDEPFGAIDPITRERLQNEFLRLQREIKKTIIFVTHDIDEAIKMGDQIAILRQGGILQQYGPPEEILANPANQFVEDFVGTDRTLKQLNLVRVEKVMDTEPHTIKTNQSIGEARESMEKEKINNLLVVDDEDRLQGYVMRHHLRDRDGQVADVMHPMLATVDPDTSVKNALSEMLAYDLGYVCVVDNEDRLLGLVSVDTMQQTASSAENESEESKEA